MSILKKDHRVTVKPLKTSTTPDTGAHLPNIDCGRCTVSNSIILKILLGLFKHILVIDFEFKQPLGNSPILVCMVVKDIITQTTKKYWLVGKKKIKFPFPIDESLFVGHYLVAEVNCLLQLQLQKPKNLWDTWVENKKLYNGKIKKGFG